MLKIDGILARNIDFEVANLEVPTKTRRKTSILKLQSVKIGGVSHERLVLMLPRLSSRASGFPVASPYLWGKLRNLSLSKVSKQVVMSFCVTGMALCDIPTCLITRRKCQNSRESRTKCSFCSAHVFPSRVSGFPVASPCLWGKLQHFPLFEGFQGRLSCRFVSQAWHFVTFQPVVYRVISSFVRLAQQCAPHFTLYTVHSTLYTLHSTLYTPHSTIHTLHSTTLYTLHTPHSTLYTLHSTLLTLHSTLHTFHSPFSHSTLYTLHSTIYTLDSSLHIPHFTLHTLHFALHTLHSSALHTPSTTLHHAPPHSTVYTLHTPHSTLYTPHS